MTLVHAEPATARRLLSDSGQLELRRLAVTETSESVILDGEVTSFYLKQMAQETVKPATDGRRLVNRVFVSA
jgi:hypothetical protein